MLNSNPIAPFSLIDWSLPLFSSNLGFLSINTSLVSTERPTQWYLTSWVYIPCIDNLPSIITQTPFEVLSNDLINAFF